MPVSARCSVRAFLRPRATVGGGARPRGKAARSGVVYVIRAYSVR